MLGVETGLVLEEVLSLKMKIRVGFGSWGMSQSCWFGLLP